MKFWVIFLFLMSGCAFQKLGFSRAEWFVYREVDKYFDLNDSQEEYLKTNVKLFLKDISNKELNEFQNLLNKYSSKLEKENLIKEDISNFYEILDILSESLYEKLKIGEFLMMISSSQVEYYKKEMEERKKENADKKEKDKFEKKLERMRESYEDRIGKITLEQEAQIRLFLEEEEKKEGEKKEIYRKYSGFWVNSLSELLLQKESPESLKKWIKGSVFSPYASLPEAWGALNREKDRKMKVLNEMIYCSLTLKQRKELSSFLKDLSHDLEALKRD